ncbi:DNA polymerase III subunit gamma/tau [Buchnera aphidicola]|uniref:DNA polymerase III subunit gamma/tau n=1 Tax=Buchnera aphidicola TaxID=9 RepID=UPI0031B85F54
MNYKILARKWRPKNFSEIIGQKYIIKALSNSINFKKIHQAWLFSGSRGTGKTTIARILAKNLCCEKGITIASCEKCSICKEIEKGNFVDLIEIDAASKTKIEEIKKILENIKYAPIKSRFKIYLIDEVHMLSRYSFNALLKTLEEPPKHIKFILATTEIEKIPKTIISRCIIFYLKKINKENIILNLKKILTQENINIEKKALNIIAENSQGSMRDALNLLELSINISKKKIKKKNIIKILGRIDEKECLKLLISILINDKKRIIFLLNKISLENIEWDKILIEMLRLLHHIAMIQSFKSLWNNKNYLNKKKYIIKKLSKYVPKKIIQKCYKIITIGYKKIHLSPSPRLGMEITLLKILYIIHYKNKKKYIKMKKKIKKKIIIKKKKKKKT